MTDLDDPEENAETRRARLILNLRSQGVSDPAVLNALEQTPRDLFTPELFKERAWEDSALPIACGQTISQPFIVGLMTQALTIEPRARVLEIGTGSGYQTAVLSRLARLVYTVERYRTLLGEAEARFKTASARQYHHPVRGWRRGLGQSRRLSTVFWSRRRRSDEPKALLSQLKPSGAAGCADRPWPGADAQTLCGRRQGRVQGRGAMRGSVRSAAGWRREGVVTIAERYGLAPACGLADSGVRRAVESRQAGGDAAMTAWTGSSCVCRPGRRQPGWLHRGRARNMRPMRATRRRRPARRCGPSTDPRRGRPAGGAGGPCRKLTRTGPRRARFPIPG